MRRALAFGLLGLAAALHAQGLTAQERREGFRPLFNGRDLRGWKVYAGANWRVQNGELIGPTDSAGWIGATDEYQDFILRGEYWIDKGNTAEGNSEIGRASGRERVLLRV